MNKTILVAGALLLAAVLLLGCTGGSEGQSAGGGAAQGAGAAGGAAGAGGASATPQATQGGGGGGGNDLIGKGFADLIAAGVPAQCTARMTQQNYVGQSKMYFSGGNARVEATTTIEGQTFDSVSIVKGDKVYIKLPSASKIGPYAECDWLSASKTESQTQGQASVKDFEDVPPADISCTVWVPDATKFDATGKVCDLSNVVPSVVPSLPSGMEECQGKTGQELLDCLQNLQPPT